MDVRQLRFFMAVAEELHFGRAARRLNMSQPPLSQQIRALEDGLGVRLFTRTSRSVVLTDAGRAMMERAGDILAAMERLGTEVQDAQRGMTGRLPIGFVRPAMEGRLPGAIREFRRERPEVALELREMLTPDQLTALRAGELRVGFVRLYGHDLTGLVAELFMREPYVLAIPRGHALARMRRVPLGRLAGEPMIFHPRHLMPALHDAMTACCVRAGFRPSIVQEARVKQTAIALVAAGLGMAFVPRSSTVSQRPDVVFRPLEDEALPWVEIWCVRPETAWAGGVGKTGGTQRDDGIKGNGGVERIGRAGEAGRNVGEGLAEAFISTVLRHADRSAFPSQGS